MKHLFWIAVLSLVLFACGSKDSKKVGSAKVPANIPVDTALQSRLKAFAAMPRVQGRFGLYVYDLTAGKEVFAVDADHSQPLASNLKLLAGVAALERLGADYTYRTSLYTRGTLKGDTLKGDFALKAGLDPQLKAEDMTMFTKELHRLGIRHITGSCYLDLTLKEKVQAEQHWFPWDLSFSHYGLLFKGPDGIVKAMRYALASQGITFTTHVAAKTLAERNMANFVVGPMTSPRDWHCRFRFFRSVDRVTKLMWKNSSNTQATSLLYTLGSVVNPHNNGSAAALANAGVAYIRGFLRDSLGMKDTALVVHDGCGLCTHNHLSPRAVAKVLIYAYGHKAIYRQLMENLSIAGVDGTLHRLLADPALNGKIHGKTGTLSHPFGISSLAGYTKGTDGHDLCFAFLTSEMSVLDAHVLQKKLCLRLVGGK